MTRVGPPRGARHPHRAVERGQPSHHPAHPGARVAGPHRPRPSSPTIARSTPSVVAELHPRVAARRRACRRWSGTRRPRSTSPTRPAPAGARRGRRCTRTGSAMSRASACTAPASPRSASTGGWMPRTTARRSASAAPVVVAGLGDQLARGLGVAVEHLVGHAERHAERDQPGLRPVVQVALDAAQLGGGVVDGLGAGHGQVDDPLLQRLGVPGAEEATGPGVARARMMCGAPYHQRAPVTTSISSSTVSSASTKPDGDRDQRPGQLAPGHRVAAPRSGGGASAAGPRWAGSRPARRDPGSSPPSMRCAVGQPAQSPAR